MRNDELSLREHSPAEELREAGLDSIENATLMLELGRNRVSGGFVSEGLEYAAECRDWCVRGIESGIDVRRWNELYWRCVLLAAPHRFDEYMQYLEKNRRPAERFWMPRRQTLLPLVEGLQALEDNELDELFLAMPPRVGKTTMLVFFVTWIIGRRSENPNLYCSYTDKITKSFYNAVLEIVTDRDTYTWNEIFPMAELVSTDAKDEVLNIDRRKHYPTLTCRSIDGTLNGACDAENGVIIADDLVSGIEEALSKDRLISLWRKVDNNLIPRGKSGTKYLWCGTRWSIVDPAGVRMELLTNDVKYKHHRWKVLSLPALNEDGESNFDYDYNVGFNTEYYVRRRASFERNNDIASWNAQYMCEPIERDGALFTPETMTYYNGVLPEEEPVAKYACVDVAWGGTDYLSMPIVYEYASGDRYVVGWVFDKGDKRITQPLVANAIIKFDVNTVEFEANNGGHEYRDDIERMLLERGVRKKLICRPAPTTKHKWERINECAPEIREMLFLDDGKRSRDYSQAMQNLFSFTLLGKNKNDDAPDSLAMLVRYHATTSMSQVKIFKRFI